MAQKAAKKKDEANQTKAGLMSENSNTKEPKKVNSKSKADLDNLPKASKSETGKSGKNEGLH